MVMSISVALSQSQSAWATLPQNYLAGISDSDTAGDHRSKPRSAGRKMEQGDKRRTTLLQAATHTRTSSAANHTGA